MSHVLHSRCGGQPNMQSDDLVFSTEVGTPLETCFGANSDPHARNLDCQGSLGIHFVMLMHHLIH